MSGGRSALGGAFSLGGAGTSLGGQSVSGGAHSTGGSTAPSSGGESSGGASGVDAGVGGEAGGEAVEEGGAGGWAGARGSAGSDGGGAAGANGAAAGNGGEGQENERYPAVTLAGLLSAVELAPVRLAATGLYPGEVRIQSGGVDALFGANPPLVATNAETQALRASVNNPNLRIIFTVCEGLYRIVAKKSAGIQTLADLRGKTVDYSPGTSSAYFLHKMLALVNMTEADVRTGGTPSGTSRGDAAAYWEPNMAQYAAARGRDAVEFQKDSQGNEVYRELFNLHATAQSLADPARRRTIVRFVRALVESSARIRNDPAQVYPLLTGPVGVSRATLEASFAYERYAGGLVSDIGEVLVEEEAWSARTNNRQARSREQILRLVDDSVVKEALDR